MCTSVSVGGSLTYYGLYLIADSDVNGKPAYVHPVNGNILMFDIIHNHWVSTKPQKFIFVF